MPGTRQAERHRRSLSSAADRSALRHLLTDELGGIAAKGSEATVLRSWSRLSAVEWLSPTTGFEPATLTMARCPSCVADQGEHAYVAAEQHF